MFQMVFTHGPTPTTTSSHAMDPADVSTAVIAAVPLPARSAVTVTPSMNSTPSAAALAANPRSDAMLFA